MFDNYCICDCLIHFCSSLSSVIYHTFHNTVSSRSLAALMPHMTYAYVYTVFLCFIFCCHTCLSALNRFHFHSIHTQLCHSLKPSCDLLQKHEITHLLNCHSTPLSIGLELYVYFLQCAEKWANKTAILEHSLFCLCFFFFIFLFVPLIMYPCTFLIFLLCFCLCFCILSSNVSVAGWDVFVLLCPVGRELNSRSRSSM